MSKWPLVRLADVSCKIGSGATPRGGEVAYVSRGIPLIRSMNVVFFGFKREGLAYINESQAAALKSVEVQAGDVLLNITGASIGRVTIAPPDMEGARVNQHVCIIRPTQSLDSRYVRAFLSSAAMQGEIGAEHYGVTRQALTKQQVSDFQIPLAPLPEQRRIVERLESVLPYVDSCRQRLTRVALMIKRLRQSVLAAACSGRLTADWREAHQNESKVCSSQGPPRITKPPEPPIEVELPENWVWCCLHDIADIRGGVTKGRNLRNRETVKLPYLRVANVQDGYLDLSEIKEIDVLPEDEKKYHLERGDILFTEEATEISSAAVHCGTGRYLIVFTRTTYSEPGSLDQMSFLVTSRLQQNHSTRGITFFTTRVRL